MRLIVIIKINKKLFTPPIKHAVLYIIFVTDSTTEAQLERSVFSQKPVKSLNIRLQFARKSKEIKIKLQRPV